MKKRSTLYLLALAVGIHKNQGFVKAHSNEGKTPSYRLLKEMAERDETPAQEWLTEADSIINYWNTELADEIVNQHNRHDDYIDKVLMILGTVEFDTYHAPYTLIASIPQAYERWTARKAERQAFNVSEEQARGAWIGKLKERVDILFEVYNVKWFNNKFGQSALLVGRAINYLEKPLVTVWVSNDAKLWRTHKEPLEGQTIALKGTVKRHQIWEGEKQTTLQRIRVT